MPSRQTTKILFLLLIAGSRCLAQDDYTAYYEDGYYADDYYEDPYTYSDASLETATDQMLAPARLQKQLLENERTAILNERERMLNSKQQMLNQRTRIKLRELRRYTFHLARDAQQLRRQRDGFATQRRLLLVFVSGRQTAASRAGFVKTLTTMQQSVESSKLLRRELPAIAEDRFVVTSLVAKSLQANGRLARPPFALSGDTSNQLHRAAVRYGLTWNSAMGQLQGGQHVQHETLAGLTRGLGDWEAAAVEVLGKLEAIDRAHAERYFSQLRALLAKLKTPCGQREVLARLDGYAFRGGTVADLLNHLLEHHLALRYGTRPQLLLQELCADWVAHIDHRLAGIEAQIEYFKLQNVGLGSPELQEVTEAEQGAVGGVVGCVDDLSHE